MSISYLSNFLPFRFLCSVFPCGFYALLYSSRHFTYFICFRFFSLSFPLCLSFASSSSFSSTHPLLLLLLGRFLVRGWVARQRHRGRFRRRLLLVGGPKAVRHIFQALDSEAGAGYVPVAAALPGYGARREDYLPIPVSTDLDTVEDVVALVEVRDVEAVETV